MAQKMAETDVSVLDDPEEEKAILQAYEKGELVPVENPEEMSEKLINAARATLAKTKHISIRVSEKDLRKIKLKALESGIPYQTIIGSLLHRYAEGKITLNL